MGESKRYYFKDLMFWARNGIICVENTRTGEFNTMMVRDFAERVRAILRESEFMPPEERKKHQDFVEDAIKVCRIAQKQGRPDILNVREHVAKHPSIYNKKLVYSPLMVPENDSKKETPECNSGNIEKESGKKLILPDSITRDSSDASQDK
jgi:hypothetical protein